MNTAVMLMVALMFLGGMFESKARFNLNDFKWEKRVILLFYPSDESSAIRGQMEILEEGREGILDRDLLVVRLPANGPGQVEEDRIVRLKVAELYRTSGLTPGDFRFILIGKDGIQKLDQSSPVELKQLFGLIDSMPMRLREMREEGACQ